MPSLALLEVAHFGFHVLRDPANAGKSKPEAQAKDAGDDDPSLALQASIQAIPQSFGAKCATSKLALRVTF